MENTNNLGERIKMVREKAELSQKAFGGKVGLSQTAVTALENNQNEPRLSTFNQIVEAFKINPEWLRTGQGEMGGSARNTEPAYRATLNELRAQITNKPTPGLTSGPATVAEAENVLLREQVADLKQQVAKLWTLNGISEKLGKMLSSSDAAWERFFMRAGQQVSTVLAP
jgi:transcriptional regulator with XRE-family HTH domain